MHRTALSHDGTRIAFEVSGSGPPIVLIHGFAGDRRDWREIGYTGRFALLGQTVVALDARGHGDSGKLHRGSDYETYKMAQDVVAVLDVLEIYKADVHGYSMGGWIAMDTARCFPRRVRSLSVNGANGFAQDLRSFRDCLSDGLPGWVRQLERQYGRDLNPRRKKKLLSNDVEALRALMQGSRADISRDLAGLGIPALVIAGEHEPDFNVIKRFAHALPARFETLPGKTHTSALTAVNDVCDAILTFLEEIENSRFSNQIAASAPDAR